MIYGFDEFIDMAGFNPVDEMDITYFDLQNIPGLEAEVTAACHAGRFVSIVDSEGPNDFIRIGWGIVNVWHRCFVPEGAWLDNKKGQ